MSESDAMVTLQERMVNLIGQLTMPVVEVALVLQHHIQAMMTSLTEHVSQTGGQINDKVANPWAIVSPDASIDSQIAFDVEKVLKIVDQDRMDILSTLIRVTLIETEMNLIEGILSLRSWEQLVRQQLVDANGPGQLFSPIDLPEEW
tara:strand:- start:157 stop:597 length:441 start_codon:yes stop_codon:yes gene_type:complete